MKIHMLAFQCVMAIALSIFSMDVNAQDVHLVGLRAGSSIGSIYYAPKPGGLPLPTGSQVGFLGGAFYRYFYRPHTGFHVELSYIQKGFGQNLDNFTSSPTNLIGKDVEMSINYLQIPAMSSFYIFKGKTKVIVNLGVYVAYALSGNSLRGELDSSGEVVFVNNDLDFSSINLNRLDAGVVGGAAFQRAFDFGILELEFRYSFGLNNIYNQDIETNPFNSQNLAYSFSINYLFQLKKDKSKFNYIVKKKD
ncbi:porin family protein [Aureibacter tunicatorum]|uniref:Outer membrane protein beta-barrel domain-containing protein n=1 Tax=Aureibacter tunicatorum TaxID=866807 RepID=A0AAE3XIH0_9BACT|nr:porin family protein [Aureibacter tunicatorum]MDR6237407.1 hypothetical protein [Aureibacter tunicatorum]BDD06397.1 hypothetical protein AUTU_38800 [Aureibacter tunicatorum]